MKCFILANTKSMPMDFQLSFSDGANSVSTENEAITYNADIGLVFGWVLGVLGIVKCDFRIFDCCFDHRNRSFHTWLLFFPASVFL